MYKMHTGKFCLFNSKVNHIIRKRNFYNKKFDQKIVAFLRSEEARSKSFVYQYTNVYKRHFFLTEHDPNRNLK